MVLTTLLITTENYMLPCLNKKFLGIECPGCGIQRAASLLLQGEFVAAFKMYPAIYAIILLLGFLLIDTFFSIKHANKITIFLLITSVSLILINFLLKLI